MQNEKLAQILFLQRETKTIYSKTNAQGWEKSKYKFPMYKYKYELKCFILYLYY